MGSVLETFAWPVCTSCYDLFGRPELVRKPTGPMDGPAPKTGRILEECFHCSTHTITGIYLKRQPDLRKHA